MSDPFCEFMEYWTPSIGVADAFFAWGVKRGPWSWSFHVMPDLQPFRDSTGVIIESRAKYREHLKRVGGIEFGPSDIAQLTAKHAERKQHYAARMQRAREQAPIVDSGLARPVASRIAARVAERLEGRPVPDRKTLINIAVEEVERKKR